MSDRTDKKDQGIQVTDRRFWVVDDEAIDSAPIPERKYPSLIEELQQRAENAEAKLRERLHELQQEMRQENESYRSRMAKEMERRLQAEKEKIILEFLEVADNMERALDHASGSGEGLRQGVEANRMLMTSKLKSQGIEKIDVLHKRFDPEVAEALGSEPVEDARLDQTVIEVLQNGYRWGDRVLRPALVRIGDYRK